MAKSTTSRSSKKRPATRQHHPLPEDIDNVGTFRATAHKRRKSGNEQGRQPDEGDYVDSRSSRTILSMGRALAEESQVKTVRHETRAMAFTMESRFDDDGLPSEDEGSPNELEWWKEEGEVEEIEVDPADLEVFNQIMRSPNTLSLEGTMPSEETRTNLADLIVEKITAHEAGQKHVRVEPDSADHDDAVELPAKVVEAFSRVGILLSRYKSGRLPKLFKVLPTLPRWHEILSIMRPEEWTANACYAATRIMVSGQPAMTRIFLEEVILGRVREEIRETKKLNVHLYQALKKALYKPAAFFKGFLFPLVGSGTCTLREAHIVSSVLARVSIPVLHSAAALLRLCDIAAEQSSMSTEGGGATNVFIRILLEKRYALPYQVIDALVFHFLRFRAAAMESAVAADGAPAANRLPVLWHQCLLAFAQRYRNDVTEDQREALLDLLLVKGHPSIGPEVRRELLEGRGRGVPIEVEARDGGDDTMSMDPHLPLPTSSTQEVI